MRQSAASAFSTLFALKTMLVFAVASSVFSSASSGAQVMGRVVTGGFISKEQLIEPRDGLTDNDFATFSTRLFLDVSQVNNSPLEFVADVRDQHDFFDKLDREKLVLTETNRAQVQQLALKLPSERPGFYGSVGRFPVLQAGGIFADGAEAGARWNADWSSGVFGGLNPKTDEQTYVGFNPDHYVAGAYTLYQPRFKDWRRSAYWSNAVVGKQKGADLDRLYWFHNLIVQPSDADRVITLAYLDFVPSIRLQQASLSYDHTFSDAFTGSAGASVIDVIEYRRRQNLRERLGPSAYHEAELQGVYRPEPRMAVTLQTIQGRREADGLWRREFSLGVQKAKVFVPELGARLSGGYRANFNSDDVFGKLGLGIYSKKWEVTLDETVTYERYFDGATLLPFFTQLSLSHYVSRALYATLAVEHAKDEKVSIFSGFFKLGYAFGNRELPSVRSGAQISEAQ